ncbi:MAG: hypothetical protein E7658_06545 [Ruminococcaceae bacterium]|nr:hypothetical protein [Oscillospiraceae bacterium]
MMKIKKWLARHPRISIYIIVSLSLLCTVSFALYGMAQKQLSMTGAAEKQQFFELSRTHADHALILLASDGTPAETAHELLSAAEYLFLTGEKGKEAANFLHTNGKILLAGGIPDEKLSRILETISSGRIPCLPTVREEEEQTDILWYPHPLMRSEQMDLAKKCAGISGPLTEVHTADNTHRSVYTCRNLYIILTARGYPLEYAIHLPYSEARYSEENCRETALYWIRTNIPRDILGTDPEIEACIPEEQGYFMTVRCRSGVMDIFIRNDNGKVSWFDGKKLSV